MPIVVGTAAVVATATSKEFSRVFIEMYRSLPAV
jgi:hypothetical protein